MRIIIIIFSLFVFCNSFAQSGWQIQKSGTTKNLLSVSTTDGVNGVIVGLNGIVLTTGNMGLPWFQEQSFTNQNLYGVTSISARILLAVGPKDSIYRSVDRGATWVGVRSHALGECFSIGGVHSLSAVTYDSVGKLCVVAGDQQEVIFSEDSGKHWEERLPYHSTSGDLTALRCVSTYNGAVLATGDTNLSSGLSELVASSDQGDDWTKHSAEYAGISKSGTPFSGCNSRTWVAVGKRGHIYHSKNKGGTWDSIPSWTTQNLNAVCFADEINGFAVGDSGVILVTRDGGYNWLPQVSPTTQNLRSISMGDPFHGFICGDNGTILYTQDGGFTAGVNGDNQVFLNIQNYPNPFPSRTTIHIDLPQAGHITVSLYNMLGIEIAKIADGNFDEGPHIFEWNATDIPSGVYVCRLAADGKSAVSEMIITK